MKIRNKFKESLVFRSSFILKKNEKIKILLVLVIQIGLGLLDLLGIAFIGALGALAVTGISSQSPGNRVSRFLYILKIHNLTLQEQALWIGCVAASILVGKTLLSLFFVRKITFFLSRRGAHISTRLISKVLSQPLSSLQEKSIQQIQYAITAGVDTITMGVLNTAIVLTSDTSLLLILSIGLFFLDPWIAINTALLFGIVAFFLYRVMAVKSKRLGIEQAELSIETSERIIEVLTAYREIFVKNRMGYYARNIGSLRMKISNSVAERAFMPNTSKYVIEIAFVIGAFTIGAFQFSKNSASQAIAILAVFLAASTRISPAVLRLQQGAITIKSSLGAAKHTLELIESLGSIEDKALSWKRLDTSHSGFNSFLSLDNVTYRYPNSKEPAVNGVSLQLASGEVLALVGPSGAGKTTLVDLLLGILEPDFGTIRIGNGFPKEIIQMWPGAIGYVPQDVTIFNGTIRDNVAMGYSREEYSDSAIWDALEVAQLRKDVESMTLALDTEVGSRGIKLSGGQRQRLGIARAMFTKPLLLVLDEATSALDGKTEADFTEAVHSLKGEVTIVIIAHRLSSVLEADCLAYISNGRVLGTGKFEELRKKVRAFDQQARLMGLKGENNSDNN